MYAILGNGNKKVIVSKFLKTWNYARYNGSLIIVHNNKVLPVYNTPVWLEKKFYGYSVCGAIKWKRLDDPSIHSEYLANL